ncbi:hypothetical protein J2T13_002596 [Paenibacillus sp. DS2015]
MDSWMNEDDVLSEAYSPRIKEECAEDSKGEDASQGSTVRCGTCTIS